MLNNLKSPPARGRPRARHVSCLDIKVLHTFLGVLQECKIRTERQLVRCQRGKRGGEVNCKQALVDIKNYLMRRPYRALIVQNAG